MVFSLPFFPNGKAWGRGIQVGGWKLVLMVGLVQSVSYLKTETKGAFHLSELIMNGLAISIVIRAFHFQSKLSSLTSFKFIIV